MNAIRTTHNLDFEACPWPRDPSITAWRVGTCHGQYEFVKGILCLISIHNDEPGNGHLEDVFQWFEDTVKNRGNGVLIIMEFMNERFKQHCIEERSYSDTWNEQRNESLMKRKSTYSEKYRKDMVTFEKETCIKFIKACDSISSMEAGRNNDGTEYQILRIDGISVDKL